MRIIIFGSTGTIGRQLILQAFALRHQVTAFTRTPQKLADIEHPNLRIFEGDIFSVEDLKEALAGQEAVIIALGGGRKGGVRGPGTRNIILAMEQTGIKRLICLTTLGAGDSAGNLNFFWKRIMFGWFLRDAYADHQLQEQHVTASALDWTIVRPAAFTDGKATGKFHHGFGAEQKNLALKISKADVALFMLRQLESEEYLRKSPGLSY